MNEQIEVEKLQSIINDILSKAEQNNQTNVMEEKQNSFIKSLQDMVVSREDALNSYRNINNKGIDR